MNKRIGIIGHGSDKFTDKGKKEALDIIIGLLSDYPTPTLISGHSPVGGIDIWSEELAKELECSVDLKIPKQHKWDAEYGYKQRNIDIAKSSDEVHVILVDKYPVNYKGMLFKLCYHCKTDKHIKSGACWTGNVAKKLGKKVVYHIIKN